MMYLHKRTMFLLVLIVLFLGSCRPEPLDIELEQATVKMVISSQIVPDLAMVVTVSKSFAALDFSEDYDTTTTASSMIDQFMVSNAKVSISYNGVTDDLFPISGVPGVYVSISTPQYTNVEYTLNVYNPETGESVSSKALMLDIIPFDSVIAQRGDGADSNDITVSINFTDPLNELNWYMINFYTQQNASQAEDPFANKSPSQFTILLSDESFTNSQVNGEYVLYSWTSDTLVTSISNISQEYYDYLSARKRGGSIFNSIVSEPINYPTNIEGGYGFFTTHFPDIKIIVLD